MTDSNPLINNPILTSEGLRDWQETIKTVLPQDAAEAAIRAASAEMRKLLALDPSQPPLELQNGHDILTTDYPDPNWAIPHMLPTGLTIMAGKPKLGKSWLSLQIALAVAAGGYVFDRKVEQGKVLYLALEDNKRRLKSRMQAQGWLDENAAHCDYMVMSEFKEQIGDLSEGGNEILARQIAMVGYRLVIIDTMSRAFSTNNILKDSNKSQEVVNAMGPIQEMAIEQDCAVVFVDHHNKVAGVSGEDAINDIMGSISKGGVADTAWGLYRERGKTEAKLQITGRDIDEVTLAVKFDKLTGCWQSVGDYYALNITQRRQEILDYIELVKEATCTNVARELGANKGTIMRALKEMTEANLLKRRIIEDKNRPGSNKILYTINKTEI